MTIVQIFIVCTWLIIPLGCIAFLIAFGRPWRQADREISWHLALSTATTGGESIALLVSQTSLIPAAFIYGVTAVVVYWRLYLLLRSRHARRRLEE